MDSLMQGQPHLTPQQRMRAAQQLRRRAASQPGLKVKQRKEFRRTASNLVKLNAIAR